MSRLKEIRDRLSVTQQQLADEIGCSQANVWQIESNGQALRLALAERLIEFSAQRGLRLTLDQVYGRKPLPQRAKAF